METSSEAFISHFIEELLSLKQDLHGKTKKKTNLLNMFDLKAASMLPMVLDL